MTKYINKFLLVFLGVALFFGALILLSFLIPGPVDSVAYSPEPPMELTGALAPNENLKRTELLAEGLLHGPEDVDVDQAGRIYGGTRDGRIVRILKDGAVETFAETGGRPLGLHFDAHGNLIVCDAWKGLLSIDPQGEITVLSTEAEGEAFRLTNDLDIDSRGIIYFTDASSKFHRPEYKLDLLEARPHGRLLSHDPETGKTRVLLKDLYFANGVALSRNEDFVLVNETSRYRITRYWLKGEKAGAHEIFVDNLPGFPDGISANRRGTFWLAIPSPRKAILDRLHPMAFLKDLFARVPEFLLPKPAAYGLVVGLDEEGRIIRSLHDPDGGHVREVTSVEEDDGYLYLGNLERGWLGRVRL